MVHYGYLIQLTNGLGIETSFQILSDNVTCRFKKQANLGIRNIEEVEQFEMDMDWSTLERGTDNITLAEELYAFVLNALHDKPVHMTVSYYGFGDIVNTETGEILQDYVTPEDLFVPDNLLKIMAKDRIIGPVSYNITPIGSGISEVCLIDLIPEGSEE